MSLLQRLSRLSSKSLKPITTFFKPTQSTKNSIKGPKYLLHYDEISTKDPSLDGHVFQIEPGNILHHTYTPFLCRKTQLGLHGNNITLGYNDDEDRIVDDNEFQSAMWGPINGVYCTMIRAVESGRSTIVLWNPSIREYHVLPPIPKPLFPSKIVNFLEMGNVFEQENTVCGYGYDYSTNDYKILLINIYGDEDNESYHHYCFNLYSLATNKWKQLDPFKIIKNKSLMNVYRSGAVAFNTDIDLSFYWDCDDGVYLNGTCHWLIDRFNGKRDGILCFNFGNVGFHFTPIPKAITKSAAGNVRLTTVNGLLALIIELDYDYSNCTCTSFDVWVMSEYGVEDSWIRAYKVALMSPGWYISIVDNQFFVREAYDDEKWKVVSYCLATGERCEYCWLEDESCDILPYRESLVSVNPQQK